jgi:hypothetical protein
VRRYESHSLVLSVPCGRDLRSHERRLRVMASPVRRS